VILVSDLKKLMHPTWQRTNLFAWTRIVICFPWCSPTLSTRRL